MGAASRMLCVLAGAAAAPRATGAPSSDAPAPHPNCDAKFEIAGDRGGSPVLIPTGWKSTPLGYSDVLVEKGAMLPHMGARAYFADRCAAGTYNNTHYMRANLLGKTLKFSTDLAGAGCGCNAALYMTSMGHNRHASECFDHYCDANNVCGQSCAEIDIMEANQHAWHSTLHTKTDADGAASGFGGGGDRWNGPRNWTDKEYGIGGKCIDTARPFQVSASFPIDKHGVLEAMQVTLSQEGRGCRLHARVDGYARGTRELTHALLDGMTPIVSYWAADDMLWMDGPGKDGEGPCRKDSAKKCAASVRFWNFSIEDLDGKEAGLLEAEAKQQDKAEQKRAERRARAKKHAEAKKKKKKKHPAGTDQWNTQGTGEWNDRGEGGQKAEDWDEQQGGQGGQWNNSEGDQEPQGAGPQASGCGGCATCVAVTPNSLGQAITDEQCAPCALNGQSWWPCMVGGEWSNALCQCAGSTGPSPTFAPTSAPTPTHVTPKPPLSAHPARPPVAGAVQGDMCTAGGPSCAIEPGEGISSWFTKELFEQMFPHLCSSSCHGCSMLQYECLIKATAAYPKFANSSSPEDNKRELAAWLGEMSQETTGGGCGASDVNADGTCSCGPAWCDGHAGGGCASWGLCFVEEAGGQYCSHSSTYPCSAGREYRGRGPKQLSWNYNYGQFSEDFCGNKNILLQNPDWVASNPTLAWASSMWFWFTGGACLPGEQCKPSCHDVFLGKKPMCSNDHLAGRKYGLGWVTNIINGGLECGGAGQGKCDYRVHSRVRFYKHFCGILGVEPLAEGWTEEDNLFCHEQKNYVTVAPQACS